MQTPGAPALRVALLLAALLAALLASGPARAAVEEGCTEALADPTFLANYDENIQRDFLLNFFALTSTFSPLHGPTGHRPGHGTVGVDLNAIPPLSCQRRAALAATKTEEPPPSPIIPRLRAGMAGTGPWGTVVYGGLGFLPPVPVAGATNTVLSGELGIGRTVGPHLDLGFRLHATSHKTVADVATAIDRPAEGEEKTSVLDLFVANSMGADAMVGWSLGDVMPYLSVGFTDVSTVFWIGEDGVVSNNLHPYAGPVVSLGIDGLYWDRLRLTPELYAAPGGWSTPDENFPRTPGRSYGHLYTARLYVGWEL